MAEDQLCDAGVQYQVITIEGLNVDSGLTGNLKEARWSNVHEMNVPGRNTIFIGLAMSIAENMGIDEVWYGADYSDRENLFPDCYQEYVMKMNEVMKISGVKPIRLVAPLLGMTKEIILETLDCFWGITKNKLYTGYEK
jgi:7-cyano-7-deazaguanine synthase in queuosine biosynthesis